MLAGVRRRPTISLNHMSQDAYLQPYRESAETHGTEFEVTLWANRRAQLLRFEVFAQMCDMSGKRVLDAGCSRGDLATFLTAASNSL